MTVPSERDPVVFAAFRRAGRNPISAPFDYFAAGWYAALEAQHTRDEETRALLQKLEWIDVAADVGDYEACPCCHRWREGPLRTGDGTHASDCELGAFLARAYVEQSDRGARSDNV